MGALFAVFPFVPFFIWSAVVSVSPCGCGPFFLSLKRRCGAGRGGPLRGGLDVDQGAVPPEVLDVDHVAAAVPPRRPGGCPARGPRRRPRCGRGPPCRPGCGGGVHFSGRACSRRPRLPTPVPHVDQAAAVGCAFLIGFVVDDRSVLFFLVGFLVDKRSFFFVS